MLLLCQKHRFARIHQCLSVILLCGVLFSSFTGCRAKKNTATADFFAMNTYMTISAYGTEADVAVEAAKTRVYELENLFSRTLDTSEVSLINQNAGIKPVAVSADTYKLISLALEASRETEGAFDITIAPVMDLWGFTTDDYYVPSSDERLAAAQLVDYQYVECNESSQTVFLTKENMEIDLGGIAKGYASDEVQRVLSSYDVDAAMISLGGNVAVFGEKEDASLWKTGIADPFDLSSCVGILTDTDISVITSGGYERNFTQDGKTYIHIMNPDTGEPAESDLASVSIISSDGSQGDALSTALFVMGSEEAMQFWRSHQDFSVVLVTDDGEILASKDLEGIFAASDGYDVTFFS